MESPDVHEQGKTGVLPQEDGKGQVVGEVGGGEEAVVEGGCFGADLEQRG